MYFEVSKNKNSSIVCNIPHSSTLVPQEFRNDYVLRDEDLQFEAQYMADNYTDIIYSELLYVSSYIKSKISRIVVDIERFENEDDEPMSKVGMSAFYTKTSKGEKLRDISTDSLLKLQSIYKNYHSAFTYLVQETLNKDDRVFIVDCHSFPSEPRTYEPDKEDRPDICIGVDGFHTTKKLVDILETNFQELGYSVKINSPFSGSIVPMEFYKKDKRVISVMIEVNRKLYMDEKTFLKSKNIKNIGRNISRVVIKSINSFLS